MYNSSLIDDPYLDGLYDAVRALPGDLRWWPRGWPEELCDDVLFHVVRHAAYRLQLCRVPDLEALLRSLADRVNADLALGLRASRRLITTRHIAAWTADPGPGRVRFVDRRGHVVAWHALFVQRGCRAALVRHAAVSLYVAGSSRSKTAAELGVSGATVTRALAARGVVTRGPAPWSAEDRKLLHAAVEDSGLLSKRAAVAEVAAARAQLRCVLGAVQARSAQGAAGVRGRGINDLNEMYTFNCGNMVHFQKWTPRIGQCGK